MRYGKKGLILVLAVLMISFFVPLFLQDTDNGRIHQHREAIKKPSCEHEDGRFCTHLPLVSIETGGLEVPGGDGSKDVITVSMKVFDDHKERNHLTDEVTIDTLANIRYRGNSSLLFDKKGYMIKLVDEDGLERKEEIMGMEKHDEWVLHGPFLDKTLIRNYMCYNISGEIMEWAPNVRFCELFVDGNYQGIYLMEETISRGDGNGRVPVEKASKDQPYSGYIIRVDRDAGTEERHLDTFGEYSLRNTVVAGARYPAKEALTEPLRIYIEHDFSRFEKALYSYDYDDIKYGFINDIDVNSFVDYALINDFTMNADAGHFSTFVYKNPGGKLKMLVWDFNNSFNNYQEVEYAYDQFFMTDRLWYFMLFKDEDFVRSYIHRYHQLRKTYLSEDYWLNYVDETVAYLGEAIDRNFEVWGYTFVQEEDLLEPASRNARSYDEAIEDLKTAIIKRGEMMDRYVETTRQFCHDSKNKKFNH